MSRMMQTLRFAVAAAVAAVLLAAGASEFTRAFAVEINKGTALPDQKGREINPVAKSERPAGALQSRA